jgi:hypothetical protein
MHFEESDSGALWDLSHCTHMTRLMPAGCRSSASSRMKGDTSSGTALSGTASSLSAASSSGV